MTREEHLKFIRITSSQKRGNRIGLVLLCAGPDCAGAEMFARGLSVDAVVAAANVHLDDVEG